MNSLLKTLLTIALGAALLYFGTFGQHRPSLIAFFWVTGIGTAVIAISFAGLLHIRSQGNPYALQAIAAQLTGDRTFLVRATWAVAQIYWCASFGLFWCVIAQIFCLVVGIITRFLAPSPTH